MSKIIIRERREGENGWNFASYAVEHVPGGEMRSTARRREFPSLREAKRHARSEWGAALRFRGPNRDEDFDIVAVATTR